MKVIKKVSKNEFKKWMYDLDIKDENLYKEANNPNKIGIFQMNGGTASSMIDLIKPSNFEELNAVNAFARPGTMSFAPIYVKNRETGSSPYPKQISDLLSDTHSTCIYQEQTMEIFHKIGGFTMEETNTIRGLMKSLSKSDKKKKDLDEWDEIIKKFQKGCEEKGISKLDAKKVANDLLKMSSYVFNRSHSAAYTYIALMTLYLSVYFRKFFYSSVLHYEAGKDKYLMDRLRSVKMQGFKVLPPNINKSLRFISPVPGADTELIFGLEDVKHVGEAPAQVIMENAPYKDFIDLYLKIQGKRVTIRAIRALVAIGAFDEIYPDRKRLMTKVNKFWEEKKSIKIEEKLRFLWNKISDSVDALPGLDATRDILREYEKEYLGFNFFITPFTEEFMEKIYLLNKKGLVKTCFKEVSRGSAKVPVMLNSMRVFNDKNKKEMAFLEIEDFTGERLTIPVFQSIWAVLKLYFIQGKVHMINLYLDKKEDGSTQIMIGRSGWAKPPEISRFVKRLDSL